MVFLLFKIKPLTEEEKAQKLAELREKMAEKRARKAAEEAKEAKANELIRRKAGKVRFKTRPFYPSIVNISTGSHADQRRSKEQAASKRHRSKAPRFVSLTSTYLTLLRPFPTCAHLNLNNASFIRKGE